MVKLFDGWSWRIPMPAPFDSAEAIRASTDVYSKYNTNADRKSSLHPATLSALLAYADLAGASENGDDTSGLGAVGHQGDDYFIGEYPDGDGLTLTVFAVNTGKFIATNIQAAVHQAYVAAETKFSGAALLFTLMPMFMEDGEFREAFNELRSHRERGFTDIKEVSKTALLLCDNVYRRMGNAAKLGDAGVNTAIPSSENIQLLTDAALKGGAYSPDAALYGTFQYFDVGAKPSRTIVSTPHHAFTGRYRLSERDYTDEEQRLIPRLPDWFTIPPEAVSICRHIQATTGGNQPIRNIMLRGPAGTGKTEMAKAIAAGLSLPYLHLTCSAGTEISDLLGQILPEMGGNFRNASAKMPSLMDIQMDPASAYAMLTGEYDEAVEPDAVLSKMLKLAAGGAIGQSPGFQYVQSPLVRAMRDGYLIELQEPTVISNPGVLVGLNSLLDRCQSVTLPNGERIDRHPEAVIVITTNTAYEGCRNLNQSFSSRAQLILDIDGLDEDTVVNRAIGASGCTDAGMVRQMARVVHRIQEKCQASMITDGSCGVRELTAWVQSAVISNDPYQSALYTVIPSATSDPESRQELIELLQTEFTPNASRREMNVQSQESFFL